MLHPVGDLPAAVYWRRRALVLTLAVSVLGGGGWLLTGLAGSDGGTTPPAAAGTTTAPAATPALEQVVPSLAAVQMPTPAPTTTVAPPAPTTPAPVPGGPCTDDMITVTVQTPGSAPARSKPTFQLVVVNASPVPCVRALDKGLQELVLTDGAGNRVWGSNDCFPEASTDTRTLAPGEQVSFPVEWSGLSSVPGCAAPRTAPPAGQYAVRGRLDTKVSADAPLTLT